MLFTINVGLDWEAKTKLVDALLPVKSILVCFSFKSKSKYGVQHDSNTTLVSIISK